MNKEILEQLEIANKALEKICAELEKLETIYDYRIVLNQREYMTYRNIKPFKRYEIGINIEKLDELIECEDI